MSGELTVALDVGSATTALAVGGPGGRPLATVVEPTPDPADLPVFLSKLLATGRERAPGALGDIAVTMPARWLDGTAEGVRAHERLRRVLLAELGWGQVTWLDQVDCIAAAASHDGRAAPSVQGPLLVCDLGARTIAAARCAAGPGTVRADAVAVADRHRVAGRAFAEAVAAATPVPAFDALFAEARTRQARRAAAVLSRAWTHPRYREAPVYRLGDAEITAGTLVGAFTDTAEALTDVVRRVLDGTPAGVALAGGFGMFPLAGRVLADTFGLPDPSRLGPAAAVRGALLIAAGAVTAAPPARPAVTLPLHRLRRGLLEVREVPLDPGADIARHEGRPVRVEIPDRGTAPFHVRVDGRDVALPPPDVPPGEYLLGLRPSHAGPGALVLYPAGGAGEPRPCPIPPAPVTDGAAR
ncbi:MULTISPECIES: hypothetical protein [Actinomadura]|uniref:hypothetical protein n=1 Tax=Actinomadura TaxID=1988 RepID=UPI0004294441|nr:MULTISPECIES: hypothetical protein [Actinomadura]RSN48580.1 hypothetical protein DMH08_33795 [Actinomadura sp. WAC 06369]